MNNLENKFLKVISKIIKINNKKNLNLKFNEISQWDSLKNLQLLVTVEEKFKVKFSEKELTSFSSLKKIFYTLKKKLNEKNKKLK
tara:strand:- start:186 stop:440 length:255 start_codon:yes stop_codon:yes gene_type:complete